MTHCELLSGDISEVGSHIAYNMLHQPIYVLIVEITWNVVSHSSSRVDKSMPHHLVSIIWRQGYFGLELYIECC